MSQTLILSPAIRAKSWLRETITVLGASLLIALSGPFALSLPFTPVPLVIQCHLILFFAALFGSKRGALAVALFLFQAAVGFPVLAGGKGGLLAFAGPTGGYLIGYLVGAYLTGLVAERLRARSPAKLFGALVLGNAVVYLFGFAHLANFVGPQKAFLLGILPFIAGDLFKTFLAIRGLKALA